MSIQDGEIEIETLNGITKRFRPASMKIDYDSLATADSGRTDDGTMVIDWVLSRARKVNITLPPMTGSEAGEILNLVMGRIYRLTYRDAIDNAARTITCYTSKSNATLYSGVIRNGIWTGCAFNAIQTGGEP